MNFHNLDDDPAFKGHNTTTEFLARVVFERMVAAIRKNDLGAAAARRREPARDAARVPRGLRSIRGAGAQGRPGARTARLRPAQMPREIVVLVPGRLQTRTGGYEYDRRMIAGLRERGWRVDVRELDASFPHPTPAAPGGRRSSVRGYSERNDGARRRPCTGIASRRSRARSIALEDRCARSPAARLRDRSRPRHGRQSRGRRAPRARCRRAGRRDRTIHDRCAVSRQRRTRPDRACRARDRSGAALARLDRRLLSTCCRLPRSQRARVMRFCFARWRRFRIVTGFSPVPAVSTAIHQPSSGCARACVRVA